MNSHLKQKITTPNTLKPKITLHHFSLDPERPCPRFQSKAHNQDAIPKPTASFPHTAPQTTARPPTQLTPNPTRRIANPIRDAHLLETHPDPPLRNGMHDINNPKRRAAQRAKNRYSSNGPEDELEVKVIADVSAVEGLGDGHGEDGVSDHPRDDHVGADGAVVVLLLLGVGDGVAGGLEAVAEVAEGLVVAGVDVELLRRHLELDGGAALGGDAGGAEVGVDDVVALGAPGDVVRVAEGVHLQRADVRRQQGEVLCR